MNTASPTIEQTGSRKINRPDGLPPVSLHLYAIVVACATFLLIIAGGMVTSTGSALAVPDWPLSNGQFFPKMEGGVFYEHGHRMIAGTVGVLTFILAAWLWRKESRPAVRKLGLAAVGVVLLQATLGGMTVLLRLPVPISVAHACLGQIFFCLVVSIAVLTGTAAPFQRSEKLSKFQRLAILTTGFVFLQLIAGATVRHTGRFVHPHLLGAFLVTVHVILLLRRIYKDPLARPGLRTIAYSMPALVIMQLVFGYISWRIGPVIITTLHVAVGALIFAGCTLITLFSFQEKEPLHETTA